MMTYKEFRKMAEKKILEFAPEEYQGKISVEIMQVNKVNMTLDEMVIICDSRKKPCPTIHVEQMYQNYVATGDFESTMKTAILNAIEFSQRKTSVPKLDLESVKERIVYRVINTAQNRALLASVPNRPFLDLSIVYYWVSEGGYDYKESAMITNQMAQYLSISEDGLYELAKQNNDIISPTVIKSLPDILSTFGGTEYFPEEIDKDFEFFMYALSNKDNSYGAAAMLDNASLSTLASILDDDFFILPSSIHEIIAIPVRDKEGTAEELADMVHDINLLCVKPTDRLSNQVYRYDRAADKVILVTDTKNKRLVDAVAV